MFCINWFEDREDYASGCWANGHVYSYVWWIKKAPDDNPTLGIVLCSETDEDIARYSILHGNEQLFASKYKLYLPTEEELREEIETQKAIFYLQQKDAEEEAGGEPNA